MPPLIDEITGAEGLLAFGLWSLAIFGVSKALFRSFPALELKQWLLARRQRRLEHLRRTAWELHHGIEWNLDAARGDQLAARRPLSEVQVNQRRELMDRLQKRTRGHRALLWMAECLYCQGFWSAVIVLMFREGSLSGWLTSSFAYATGVLMLGVILERQPEAPKKAGGCRGEACR